MLSLWKNRPETYRAHGDPVAIGQPAPDFRLLLRPERTLGLRKLIGRPVILAFYPGDWEPVSMDQLAQYQEALAEFHRLDAQLLGISVDSVWSHQAVTKELRLGFPLLADFEPKGAVAKAYGVYRNTDGTSERALFVVDPKGRIAWSEITQICVNPGIDGILTALENMERRWP